MCSCPPPTQSTFKNIPNRKRDLEIAKAILQRRSNYSGDNVFDHLSDLIRRIIDEDPPNVADYFDEYSRIVREEKFHMTENNLLKMYSAPSKLQLASNIMNAFKISLYPECPLVSEEEEAKPEDESEEVSYAPTTRDVMHLQFYWNLCGFGVEQESYLLSHSIEKFEKNPPIKSCRFWGKVFGLKKNYYVLEVELQPEEIAARVLQMKSDMIEKGRINKEQDIVMQQSNVPGPDIYPGLNWQNHSAAELTKIGIKQPSLPRNYYQKPSDIPPELVGKGLNRKTYFVCNDPLQEWIELPIVTPKQIAVCRVTKKFLTGSLEASVVCYPPFPGKEKHYLRAMIARITAGTAIAPVGYMKVGKERSIDADDEEEEDEEEEEEGEEEEDEEGSAKRDNDKPIIENVKYKAPTVHKLLDLQNWQHTAPAILKQGRVVAYDEKKYRKELGLDAGEEGEEAEEEVEEEEDEEDEDISDQEGKGRSSVEVAPALFTSLSEDMVDLNIPSWCIRQSNHLNTKNMTVVVKSNVWPGAYAFAMEKIVDNLYVGWGNKCEMRNNSPQPLVDIQEEYPIGPEILEILDPSNKDEEDWRIAHMKIKEEHKGEEAGGEDDLEDEADEEDEEDE